MSGSTPSRSPLTISLLFLSALVTAVWLVWCWGAFNASSWNDVRLAPAFALRLAGGSIYGGPSGVPNTWMYGPLPIWALLPATWAPDPASALGIAGGLNLATMLIAIGLVCALTPVPGYRVSRSLRLGAFLLTLAFWPRATWQFIQADNLAVAVGLLGNLVLLRSRSAPAGWLAALLATAALLCKQTAIAVPLAQLAWLGWDGQGRRAIATHLLRLLGTGLAWVALLQFVEDPTAVWFTLFTLPGGLPWVSDLGARLGDTVAALVFQVGVPVATTLWLRRSSARTALSLPLLSFAFALLPGLAALLTYGGNINSMQGFELWLPAGTVVLLTVLAQRLSFPRAQLTAAALTLLACGLNLSWREHDRFGLNHQRYDDALALARTYPGEIWFPWHPLVTIYSENRRYADEDGIAVRALSGHGVTRSILDLHLPPHFQRIAVPAGTPQWGVAAELRPADARRFLLGEWVVDEWKPVPTEP